ncbi:MAG: formylglycine-generating enzyme family protein [Deltaproteobacteria bacterium]|nr:formylglycine-generating enzyme family protein [Deltaproteobacteria bacterium]
MPMSYKNKIYAAIILSFGLLAYSPLHAATDDYDLATGEPNCVKCHTPERRYSIDYTRDSTCVECHGPGVSGKFNAINNRYRLRLAENAGAASATDAAPSAATAPATAKAARTAPKGMVLVPAGEFTMGSNDWWPKSQPEHKRNLKAFYIDKFEVTNKRYKAFVDGAKHPAPDHWPGGKMPVAREDHPVVFVDWHDADAFCKWEGKRLPTEPEWEKAARGADKRAFPWGAKFDKDKANTPQYDHKDTMPVGSFENGKSPYGAYDMAGNVWEWTADWFNPYPGNAHPDENYGDKFKTVRGGSWYDCTYYKCGISAPAYNRIFFNPKTKNNNFGFRCAKSAR